MACILTLLFWVTKNAMVKSRDHATLFFPGRVRGAGPGVWGILVPRARRFLVTWSWQIKPRMGSGAENRFCVFEFIIFYQLTWITRRCLTQLQFNTFKRDEFLYCFVQTKVFCYRWFSPSSNRASLFKYIFFVLFFSLLLHRLAVRKDQFAVLYFLQVIIVLIQVYNWEIRHHSTVRRCLLADIL